MAVKKVKFKLQGHEKFPLREGWINKALIIIPDVPDVFLRKDAADMFGIGSNMVKSLRYWMRAFGLTIEKGPAGTELTDMGKIIAKYDSCLEKAFTLWIMHSFIAKNREGATTWFMYFNHCDADELKKSEIEAILLREVKKYVAGQKFSEKSLSSDVDVLLNMYSKNKEKSDPEDKNTSPFSQLALMKKVDGKYFKNRPDKRYFTELIVLYELILMSKDSKGISIEEAVHGENGLANIYNLTSVMANDYFDRLADAGYIQVDRTAGLDMIYLTKKIGASDVLKDYYQNC